jgi:hypothetical protein
MLVPSLFIVVLATCVCSRVIPGFLIHPTSADDIVVSRMIKIESAVTTRTEKDSTIIREISDGFESSW